MRMLQQRIGFIGAGQMAMALGQAFASPACGWESVAGPRCLATGGRAVHRRDGRAIARKLGRGSADVVFLAVKPQHIVEVMRDPTGGDGQYAFRVDRRWNSPPNTCRRTGQRRG